MFALFIDGYQPASSETGIGGYLEGNFDTGGVITLMGGDLCPTVDF
jgi:hypothetical protein